MTADATGTAPLRVGVVLDGPRVAAWIARALTRVADSPACTLAVALTPPPEPERAGATGLLDRLAPWGRGAVERHLERDRARHPVADPFERVDVTATIGSAERLTATGSGGRALRLAAADARTLARQALDVLVTFRDDAVDESVLSGLDVPVWAVLLSATGDPPSAPPGLWEVFSGEWTCGVSLVRLAPDRSDERVLATAAAATDFESVALTRSRYVWKAAEVLGRELERLHRDGDAYYGRASRSLARALRREPGRGPPSNVGFWSLAASRFAARVAPRIRRVVAGARQTPRWFILYDFRTDGDGAPGDVAPGKMTRLDGAPGMHWVDPFPVRRDGEDWIFFEEMAVGGTRGRISAARLAEGGVVGEPVVVLDKPYHLSYPFLLEWEGDLFMVPESGDQGVVDAYRCTGFPDRWEHHARLMENHLYDPTLVEHGGLWWLFGTVAAADGFGAEDELFLYFADSPLATAWTAHPENPIVSDAGRARPAGPVFRRDGRLYRAGQDCRVRYGRAVRFFEIDALSPSEYREHEVGVIEPDWDREVIGLHHFSFSETLMVADAKTGAG